MSAVVALSVLIVALIAMHPGAERGDTKIARVTPTGRSASMTAASVKPKEHVAATRPREGRAPVPPATPPAAARTAGNDAARQADPRAAIVIDDLGQSLSHLEQLVGLNLPLSIAVIPGLPASDRTVSEASRQGIEMLLHQPMEPHEAGGKNPGAGVLLTSMSSASLRAQVRENLAAVPGAVGVNNHMGSRFTEDAAGLAALMAEIKEHDLFWLDSRTTPVTRGVEVAHAFGVQALERDIFLDAEVNLDFIRRQVRRLIEVARSHGTAVGIGHPHPETIAVLREMRGELLASGVALVSLSALVRSDPVTGNGPTLAAALAGKGGIGVAASDRKTTTP